MSNCRSHSPAFPLLLPLVLLLVPLPAVSAPSVLDKLSIEVKGRSRAFAYTNKESAFYYGETNGENRTSWQGFNVYGFEFLDDYALSVDGETMPRTSASKTLVYPDYLERTYPNGIIEQLRVADSLPLFSVIVTAPKQFTLEIVPYFTDGRSDTAYETAIGKGFGLIARRNHRVRTPRDNYPVWLAICGKNLRPEKKNFQRRNQFSPLSLHSTKANTHIIAFAVADLPEEAFSIAQEYVANPGWYFKQRRGRMEHLLGDSPVETADKRFDQALAWAKLSLDALLMNQGAKGIFAGLPWFNNYWGRDTFIALPGATLVTGRFAEAKSILSSFAMFQNTDSTSTDYGRIPNLVTTTDKAYNTADGTPRFVMMARAYVLSSGDSAFAREIYPSVQRSIRGTLKYHTDSLGFLTHGDAETWMDAVGPDGPWSPRGNRANDIQALWDQQLDAGIWFASRNSDATSAQEWGDVRRRLRNNFTTFFLSGGVVADHLNPDGTTDRQVRPNQIFVSSMLGDSMRAVVTRTVTSQLTYEYGVASLSQNDEDFHPYHNHPPYYPKDAAYHNGSVWTWLQGPLISELCHLGGEEVAARITRNSVHQILDRGAVGTQSELLDAVPKPGESEPQLSGTDSQAWNLAEFIRNFYEDYLGLKVDLMEHLLVLRPQMPKFLRTVNAGLKVQGSLISVSVEETPSQQVVRIKSSDPRSIHHGLIELQSTPGSVVKTFLKIPARCDLKIISQKTGITVTNKGDKYAVDSTILVISNRYGIVGDIPLLAPRIPAGLKAISGPEYPLLANAEIKKEAEKSARVMVEQADPEHDDVGPGTSSRSNQNYSYPQNPVFVPGSFDLTHFSVRYDTLRAYFLMKFRALSDPGWHPEYGFQLTFAAIAIDEDGIEGSGARLVPKNANYLLDAYHAYERLILVGGGVQIQDKGGKILAAYYPTQGDVSNPLGEARTATVSFALPLAYLGRPTGAWTFTVLAGAQDDHGGAGIGEFRTVARDPGEWTGGGKENPLDPNVYDLLVAPTR